MSSNANPYQPPQTDPIKEPLEGNDWPLASPGQRLIAAVLDWLAVLLLLMIALLIYLLIYGAFTLAFTRFQGVISPAQVRGPAEAVIFNLIWLLANWNLLKKGQTLGKSLLRIMVVRTDGSSLDPVRYLSHRVLPILLLQFVLNMPLPAAVAMLGSILMLTNVLFIFRSDRRCIHDLIADTKVVRLN